MLRRGSRELDSRRVAGVSGVAASLTYKVYAQLLAASKVTERAYIDIRGWEIRDRGNGKRLVGFTLANTGRTPADIKASLLKWRISSTFLEDAQYDGTVPVDPLTISQGTDSRSFAAFGPLSEPQQKALERGDAQLFFWGTIDYVDKFKNLHHRRFATTYVSADQAWYAPKGGLNDETDD